jgi:hypothetical protein
MRSSIESAIVGDPMWGRDCFPEKSRDDVGRKERPRNDGRFRNEGAVPQPFY